MLDLRYLVENIEWAKKNLSHRGVIVDEKRIVTEYKNYREALKILEQQRTAKNQIMKSYEGKPEKNTIVKVKKINEQIQDKESLIALWEAWTSAEGVHQADNPLINLPNYHAKDVPVGSDASTNVTLREVGEKPNLAQVRDYLTLAERLDIIDVQRGAKVSGSRFGYLKGAGALLEFALVQYAMQELTKVGFTAVVPPVIVNEPYMAAMGYLAQGGADEVYHLEKDKQYFVGTSEQSMGPYHANEILPETDLPKKYIAFSTCFRREAGSYGKDTKGILRVHQFDKVEMFIVCAPNESEKFHQKLLAIQEKLVQGLGIPYRVVQLCTGDLGFPSAKTYDIECWLPGQNDGKGEYRETHSTSNTTDYQARALNIRMKGKDGKNVVAHMLNGTAFAIGRTIIAILENYQQPDGSVKVPDALKPFMHGIEVIQKT